MGLQLRRGSFGRVTVTLMAMLALVAQPFYGVLSAHVANAAPLVGSVRNVETNEIFSDFTTAINDADTLGGQTLRATGDFVIDDSVAVNKSLTITGDAATINTGSSTNVFHVTAQDVKINGFTFVKTNTVGDFRFINLVTSATNAKVWENTFKSSFNIGDGNTVRGLVVSPGTTGYDIRNNAFSHVRQPAYIDASTGTILGNYTEHTKGWVVTSGSNITFTGNTWGTGVSRNVLDIAIIAEATNNYPDTKVVQISTNNNDAVVENQFGGTKVLSDAYVAPTNNGNVGDDGSAWHPYTKIQDALSRVVEGGTVRVANGTYTEALVVKKNGTKLLGESRTGVMITPLSNQYGQGLTTEGLNDVTFSDFTINAAAVGGGGYALKAHKGSNLVLSNLTVNGAGPSVTMGGVDVSGINGVTISNVTSQNFKKNGFAFSSMFDNTDPFTRSVTLNNIASQNNGWAGVAFYATNNAGTVGQSFPGVTFIGTNVISGNSKGLEIVGDSDALIAGGATPRFGITSATGGPVDLAATNFSNNAVHIVNNQTSNLSATNTLFDGKFGRDMTSGEANALQAKTVDKNDKSYLGRVLLDDASPVIVSVTPAGGSILGKGFVTFNVTSTDVNASYSYVEFNKNGVWKTDNTKPSADSSKPNTNSGTSARLTIDTNAYPEGVYGLKVNVVDAFGNTTAQNLTYTIDKTAPTVPTGGTPHNSTVLTNDFYFNWNASTDNQPGITYEFQSSGLNNPDSNGSLVGAWNSIANGNSEQKHLTLPKIHSTGAPDGAYYWQVRAIDAAGNKSAWSQVWNMKIDTTKPTINFVTPSVDNASVKSSSNIRVTATDTVGLKRVVVNIRDSSNTLVRSNTPFISGTSYTLDTSLAGLPDGVYTVKANALDEAGYVSPTLSRTFTIDSKAPVVKITTPSANTTVSGVVNITGTVIDASGIKDGQITLNLRPLKSDTGNCGANVATFFAAVDGNGNWSTSFDATAYEGRYCLTALVTDNAGNTNGGGTTVKSFAIVLVPTLPEEDDEEEDTPGMGGANMNDTVLTQPQTQPAIALSLFSTVTPPQQVLGVTEATDTDVLGVETKDAADDAAKTIAAVPTEDGWKLFGMLWYWWLLLLAIIAAITAWFVARARRNAEEQ